MDKFIGGVSIFFQHLSSIFELGWWVVVVMAVLFGLSVYLVLFLRRYDSNFTKTLIYYPLTIVALIAQLLVRFMCFYSLGSEFSATGFTLMILMILTTGVIAINAGWGIRMCGMQEYKYKNANMYVGNVLLFIAWWTMIWSLVYTAFLPFFDVLEKHFDFQWINVAMIVGVFFAMKGVLNWLWKKILLPKYFRKADNATACIITLVMYGLFFKTADSLTAYFDNTISVIFLIIFIVCSFKTLRSLLSETIRTFRCKMCRNCEGQQTDYFDDGYVVETSYWFKNLNKDKVTPFRKDAEVLNAYRTEATDWLVHKWRIEYTCPECGHKWIKSYSERVKKLSKTTTEHHTELY